MASSPGNDQLHLDAGAGSGAGPPGGGGMAVRSNLERAMSGESLASASNEPARVGPTPDRSVTDGDPRSEESDQAYASDITPNRESMRKGLPRTASMKLGANADIRLLGIPSREMRRRRATLPASLVPIALPEGDAERPSSPDPLKPGDRPSTSSSSFLPSEWLDPTGQHDGNALALALGALGVIYGDIGTSPIYTFTGLFPAQPTPDDAIGACSAVFWALTLLVTLKYVVLILRADKDGEGGIFSMTQLVPSESAGFRLRLGLFSLSLLSTSLVLGDSIITPSISVLSAVEMVGEKYGELAPAVLPIACGILVLLFCAQQFGTGRIGRAFGPVMLTWFVVIGALGLASLLSAPWVLKGLSPAYAFRFLFGGGSKRLFDRLSHIVLSYTGVEALYADLGHFSSRPIRLSWLLVCYPALTLCYFGQAAQLVGNATAHEHPFFSTVPAWAFWPVQLLAVVATIIASQAMISGVFSLIRQVRREGGRRRGQSFKGLEGRRGEGGDQGKGAISLDAFPPIRVIHTGTEMEGQIYVPRLNWILMLGTLGVTLFFRTSAAIASAYAVCVTCACMITCVCFTFVMRLAWQRPWWQVLAFALVFFPIDGLLMLASLLKIPHGGYVSACIAAFLLAVMSDWAYGKSCIRSLLQDGCVNPEAFRKFLQEREVLRTPGTGFLFSSAREGVPTVSMTLVRRLGIFPKSAVFTTVIFCRVPFVPPDARYELVSYGEGLSRLNIYYGYAEPRVELQYLPEVCTALGAAVDKSVVTYFFGNDGVVCSESVGYFKRFLFVFYNTLRGFANAQSDFFELPRERVVELRASLLYDGRQPLQHSIRETPPPSLTLTV
eukprot:tig00000455_g1037.t1